MLRNVICTGRIMLYLLLLNGPFIIKTGQRRRVHGRLPEDPFSPKPIDLRRRCHAHLNACRQHEHLGSSYDYAVTLLTSSILVFIGARLYPRLAS